MINIKKFYPYLLIIASIIGLLASFILTVDTIELIKNPNIDLPCNLNPFVSCTSVAKTWQASIFGFPNSLLGIVGFAMLLVVGLMLFVGYDSNQTDPSKTKSFKKYFWLLINLGTLLAMVFVMWFFYQSVFRIGSLCIYCMTTWAVTWPIFLYTTIRNHEVGHLNFAKKFFDFVTKNHLTILIIWYLAIILAILLQFRDFFLN